MIKSTDMKKTIILVTLFLTTVSVYPQDIENVKSKLDSLFEAIEKNNKGMGNLSIFKEGKQIYNNSVGYVDIEMKASIDEKTKFKIGSISKTITAAIIMQMVEEGKLKLEHTIDKYFAAIDKSKEITIEQLLRHRSGIHNFTNSKKHLKRVDKPKTRKELLDIIVKCGSDFKPGEKMEYSNSNYVLLSMIAEKIDRKLFPEILFERIVKPLKLENTYYGKKINTKNNEALSYKMNNGWKLESETDMSIPLGAGAVVSNPHDLNIFLTSLFSGKLVSEESLKKMQTTPNGVGLGMFILPFYEKKSFGHNGEIDGFQSVATYFPEEKLSVSYNSNGVVMSVNDILIGALSIYFGMDYQIPTFKTIKLEPQELKKYVGVYSTTVMPMKLTISRKGGKLIGQGTGQPSFPLEAFEKDKFKFEQGGIVLEFNPKENTMILKQSGSVLEFKKEEK